MAIELDIKKPRKPRKRPDTREISVVSIYDRYSTYPSHGLTPQKLTAIFKEADQGDVYRQSELFEEMLEKDLHLFGVFQSRKLAVAKRNYEVIAASEEPRDTEIAEEVRRIINNIRNWRQMIEDVLDAVPKGFAALQIMWKMEGERIDVDRLEWTHQKHFRFGKGSDPRADMNEIRRLTEDNRVEGLELEPNKWVIALVKARSGHPARTSILRTCTWMYLFKNFDIKAWLQFAEVFGMPLRVGKYNAATGDEEKKALENALRNLSTDASAMIPDTTSIEFVEAVQKAATASLHGDLAGFCNAEMSKAVLGHTGSVESTPGKLGQEQAAQEVRFDLIESDANALDYIISDQIIRPLVEYNYGPQEAYPYYKTIVEPPKDVKQIAETLNAAINVIGLEVSKQYAYESLGIPQPEEGEEVVIPRPQPPAALPFRSSLVDAVFGSGKK